MGANMGDIKKVLITDLDNTLFDWVALWCACFTAMMNKVVEISGIPVEDLKPEVRRVHHIRKSCQNYLSGLRLVKIVL
jgi:hypothetical protein